MTYATLEKQIRALPEEYFDEVAAYIDYLLYRNADRTQSNEQELNERGLAVHFGSLPNVADGMKIQWDMRNEWD